MTAPPFPGRIARHPRDMSMTKPPLPVMRREPARRRGEVQTDLAHSLETFLPDALESPVVALHVDVQVNAPDLARHRHHRVQLLVPTRGEVCCHVEDRFWIVPAHAALWIPSQFLHGSRVSDLSDVYYVYVEPDLVLDMPSSCCILTLTPLVEELIRFIADADQQELTDGVYPHAIQVLLSQLRILSVTEASFTLPDNSKLRRVAQAIMKEPAERRSVAAWAESLSMAERSFERFVLNETGMTFGRWRQQLQISIALRLLADDEPVHSVALSLGYESTSAFIAMFRKHMGNPPGRYVASGKA